MRAMILTLVQHHLTLATQAEVSTGDVGASIFPVLGWLLAIVFAGGLCIFYIRRWMRRDYQEQVGFTLGDLREMLESGEITPVEFQSARDAMIAQVKKQAAKSATTKAKDAKYTPKK